MKELKALLSTGMKEVELNALFYSRNSSKNLNSAKTWPKEREPKMDTHSPLKIVAIPISRTLIQPIISKKNMLILSRKHSPISQNKENIVTLENSLKHAPIAPKKVTSDT